MWLSWIIVVTSTLISAGCWLWGRVNRSAAPKHLGASRLVIILSLWEDEAVTASYASAKAPHRQRDFCVHKIHTFRIIQCLSSVHIVARLVLYSDLLCVSLCSFFLNLWQSLYDLCMYPLVFYVFFICEGFCLSRSQHWMRYILFKRWWAKEAQLKQIRKHVFGSWCFAVRRNAFMSIWDQGRTHDLIVQYRFRIHDK